MGAGRACGTAGGCLGAHEDTKNYSSTSSRLCHTVDVGAGRSSSSSRNISEASAVLHISLLLCKRTTARGWASSNDTHQRISVAAMLSPDFTSTTIDFSSSSCCSSSGSFVVHRCCRRSVCDWVRSCEKRVILFAVVVAVVVVQ